MSSHENEDMSEEGAYASLQDVMKGDAESPVLLIDQMPTYGPQNFHWHDICRLGDSLLFVLFLVIYFFAAITLLTP